MSLFFSIEKNTHFTEDAHWIQSRSQRQASLQVQRKAKEEDKLYSSLHRIPGDENEEKFEGDLSQS